MLDATPFSPNVDLWLAAGWSVQTYLDTGIYYAIVTPHYETATPPPFTGSGGRAIDAAIELANKLPLTVDPLPPPSPSMSDRLLASGYVDDNGTFLGTPFVRTGLTLTPGAHTPGNGHYEFTIGGSPLPAGYSIFASVVGDPAILDNARPIAPGSMTFQVQWAKPSRAVASGEVDASGSFDGVGATIVKSATGVYDGTLTDPIASQEFSLQVTPLMTLATPYARATGDDTFTVTMNDVPGGLPADVAFNLEVVSKANQAQDTVFMFSIFDLTP